MHTIDEQIQLLCKNCRKSLKNVEVSKSLDLNKKKRQCDISNSMNREQVAYSWIVEKIGCNLPWSNFKIGMY